MLNSSFGVKPRRPKNFELQLTAMIDMLMIILVFLIKSTTVSDVTINVPPDIYLPDTHYDNPAKQKESIFISKTKVTYNGKDVAPVQVSNGQYMIPIDYLGEAGTVITKLFDELFAKRDILVSAGAAGGQENFEGTINIIADKDISYGIIRKVLNTAAQAQFNNYNLIILKLDDNT